MAVKVASILDYVLLSKGSYKYKENQFFQIKNKPEILAVVIQAQNDQAYLLFNSDKGKIEINDELIEIKDFDKVKTSYSYFGKVVDQVGNVILGKNEEKKYLPQKSSAFDIAEPVLKRQVLDKQLYTGILSIDLFNPIGLGQRELIVGDRQTGKTHIALNAIINQKNTETKCIYVSIGQKKQNLNYVYNLLVENDALKNTIIFQAASTSPFEQYLIPYFAMAHAGNLSYENDVLIIFDDLTKHASVYREVALLTNKPIGKEAFPSDIFYAHSKLLERSGKFVGRKSITALPILQTVDNDITSLISSNVISITDGQIITSSHQFAEGKIPAVNIGLSVSRTGSSVQAKNIKKVSKEISSLYYRYLKQIKLSKLDYDLNNETSNLLFQGSQIEKFLVQKGISYYSEKTVLLGIKIISWGLLKNANEPTKISDFIFNLIELDPFSKSIYTKYINNQFVDDVLASSYFCNAVNQFLTYLNSSYLLDVKKPMPEIEESIFNSIIKKLNEVTRGR